MSALVVEVRQRGDTRSTASINAFHTAFEAITPLNQHNYAEEGVGRRTLGQRVHTEQLSTIQSATRVAASPAVTGGAHAQFVMGATTFRYTPGGAGLVLSANEMVELRGRIVLQSSIAAGLGISAGDTFGGCFAWSIGGLVTEDFIRRIRTTAAPGTALHGHLPLLGWIDGPVTLEWIEVRYRLSAGTAFPGVGQFLVTRKRRVGT